VTGARVKSATVDERIVEQLADLAPRLRDVIGDRTFKIERAKEARPALVTRRRLACRWIGEGERHPGVAKELAVGIALERQSIRGDQQAVAQLRDAEAIIRQCLVAVEE